MPSPSRLRLLALSLAALPPAALLLGPGPAHAQDPTPPAPAPEEQPKPEIVAIDPLLVDVLRRHEQSQGGAERLGALRTVRFTLTPAVPAEEGAWQDQAPLGLSFEITAERRVRIEDHIEGREVVKLGTPDAMRVFVDAQPTALPDMVQGARAEAALLSEMLDFWIGAASGRVALDNEGRKTRDGHQVHALRVSRADGRGSGRVQMLFLDVESGLPTRLDVFDPRNGLRVETARFFDWPEGAGPKLPGRVEFTNRGGDPLVRWTLASPEFDPELAETHFTAP